MEESSSSSSFPWELLPRSIQEEILSKLPISVLVRLRSISRSFLASIRSLPPSLSFPRDPFFFLFSSDELLTSSSSVLAYQPSLDRWITFPLPSNPSAASGSLLLLSDSLFNPFTGAVISIPPPLPMQSPIYPLYLLIDYGGNRPDLRIIVVNNSDRVRSQVYDSASDSWTCRGDLPGHFHMLGSAVLLDGLLYVLSYGPDHLLRFDLFSGDWETVGGVLPSVVCSHLVAFDGRLFLVGGVELFGMIVSIQVWGFVSKDGGNWELACSMPAEIFRVFNGSELMEFFDVCDGKGILCFYNHLEDRLLMLDLVDWRWWWPSRCPVPQNLGFWLGLAVEPNADILR
ncbi:hypothetical protein J5N97_020003 [Dioscorea zingiberensis]|uniref:F-box domain-containing protein n=1 Tax=Dioscorea zingiberensis TaxID=325984 RepID=A0A9D5CFS9_9LILI|nr:hypothetical protein J5N97_020003 [Dioscorea zingiberensis]